MFGYAKVRLLPTTSEQLYYPEPMNILTGKVLYKSVNVHQLKQVGDAII